MGETVALVGILALFVVLIICAVKESRVTGKYKAFGVYGRIRAYLAMDFFAAGIAMIVMAFIPGMAEMGSPLLSALVGLLITAAGLAIYVWTYLTCPDFLKKGLIVSMLITGIGVTVKISVFFLGFVWTLIGPREIVTEDGRTLYEMDGKVYNGSAEEVGVLSNDRQRVLFTKSGY